MIKWYPDIEKDAVVFSPKTIQDLNIKSEKIILHMGSWKKSLRVKIRKDLEDNSVGLSIAAGRPFTIPDVPYDMYVEGCNLHLGPVIAIVVKRGKLSPKRLGFWTDYCRNYSDIRGLILFCMVDGIDTMTKTISGYYYDPKAPETERWKPAVLPYPGVVYQRTAIPEPILQDLKISTGGRVFNVHLFNKWEMWEVLSRAGFNNTPHTVKLDNDASLEQMLDLYDSVYCKPARGRFGFGVLKVEKRSDKYYFKGDSGAEEWAKDIIQLFRLIDKYKKRGRKYIIQQGVPLEYENKPVDFRVILQKDGTQEWTCPGVIAKAGYQGRIYTNSPSAIYLAKEALQMIFGLSPEQASEKEKEIIRICTDACRLVEQAFGIYADVGIDVVVDENLKVWILEINKIHQHTMVKYVQEDPDMYARVVTRPLEYARTLAGFQNEGVASSI